MTDAAPESEKATLHFPGGSAEFPVIRGTDGHDSIATTTITERGATRLDDQTSDASMEQRKKEGYF